jgi:hypothetical protein
MTYDVSQGTGIALFLRQRLLLVGVEGGADLVDVGAVGADGLVKLVAGGVELFGPVGDVRGHLGVDDLGVVRSYGVLLVWGMGCVFLRLLLVFYGFVFRHGPSSLYL